MPVPHIFGTQSSPVAASKLDEDFAAFQSNAAVDAGTALVVHRAPYAIPYNKLLSALLNGERFNLLMAMPEAQRAAIQSYTSTFDCLSDLGSALTDMNTAKRGDGYLSDGLYMTSGAIPLPQQIRLSGPTRRGFGNSSSNFRGAIIKASGNTGVISLALGSLTAVDVQLQHIFFLGSGAGSANGLTFTNAAGVDMNHCVVASFGGHNIAVSGGYNFKAEDIYCAQAGDSCFYIDGQFCQLTRCLTDAGQYSVRSTAGGLSEGLTTDGCHFEGATVGGIRLLGNRNRINNTLVASTAGGIGLYCSGSGLGVSNVQLLGSGGATIGLQVSGIEYRILGILSSGYDIGGRLETGFGTVTANVFEGITTGLELIGGFARGVVSGNTIAGGTHSLLHTSGTRAWVIGPNHLDDGLGNFKEMTIAGGDPIVSATYVTSPPTVASAAALTVPPGASSAIISGTTGITSIGVLGFSNRTITLIFQGALTLTDGSNLKLAGNFTTTGDDTLTLTCDGTNWYEVGRSAN